MSKSPPIFDVTRNDFSRVVLENSYRVPVLVDFWAAWCQPCQMLTPLLKRLAEESQGAFILAKVNTDQESLLATEFGVRGLPTVKVFRNGQVVDELVGVKPESAYQAVIDRYRAKATDQLLEQAKDAWREGDWGRCLRLLRKAQSLEPDNPDVRIALAEKLLARDEFEQASKLLEALPSELKEQAPASGLLAKLAFAALIKDTPDTASLEKALGINPNDTETRYNLGVRKVVEGDYPAALEQFLEILRHDPEFDEGAGRRGLLAIFDILGKDNPLVATYRRRMANLLY